VFLGLGERGGGLDGVQEAVETVVVFGGVGVAGGGDDADADVVGEEVDKAGNDGVLGREGGAVVVEGDVPIEGEEFEGYVWCGFDGAVAGVGYEIGGMR